MNLAANAVKYTASGEVALAVALRARDCAGCTIRLEVRDTGPGIARECQAAVFEPFMQLEDDEEQRRGGTGLGLAICQRLVTLMGGQIGVESAPGGGSTFWFELCLPEAAAGDLPAPADERAVPRLDRPLRVLVVDDHEINRMVATEMVKRLGGLADSVRDGRAALAALEAERYDLVLMDLRLPGIDGLATTAELRRREAAGAGRTPVVAVTAGALTSDRARCLQAGMDDCLAKPLRAAEVREALVRLGRGSAGGPQIEPAIGVDPRDSPQTLDHLLLAESCGGDPALMAEVLEAFLRSTPASLSALEAAAADAADLQREAHHIKGACQTVGAVAMAADCARLQAFADKNELAGAAATVEALRRHWDEARTEASVYLELLRKS
jgi:CheY-like chemotaxis protein/HPt (histidine-containing phosphotransfer) domain-containing protein